MPQNWKPRPRQSRGWPLLLTAAVTAIAILAANLLTFGAARAATADPLDFEPQVLAKLAKEKARANSQNAQDAAQNGQRKAGADCGSVNIGNVIGGNRFGFGPTEVNVIITGDVINANNKCR